MLARAVNGFVSGSPVQTYVLTLYIHLYSPMNGRKNAKQYKNNAVTLTILKYSATVIEHI